MRESEQEKRGKVRALREEIEQAHRQIKHLKGELSRVEDVEGFEAQAAMLKRDIASYERVLEVAAYEIIARTGERGDVAQRYIAQAQAQVKRGPGRPRKNA